MAALPLLCLAATFVLAVQCASPPNIIYILADDLGLTDMQGLGYPNNPASPVGAAVKSPNLARFREEGMLFTQAYGGPVCAPSRCTLMTGRHMGHCTIRGNSGSYTPLKPEDKTVAWVLKQAGYHTKLVGKWGLGDHNSTGYPLLQGFDEFYGYDNQVFCHNWYPGFLYRQNDTDTVSENHDHCTVFSEDLLVNETLTYLDQRAAEPDVPFFLYLAFVTPHAGDCAFSGAGEPNGTHPVPNEECYGDMPWTKEQKDYAAVLTRQDRDVGTVMAKLMSTGLDDKTLVIYTSDNGVDCPEETFFASMYPFRGCKRSLFEGGVREPMVVRWPGHIVANSTTDHLFYPPDFMATAADFAGLSPVPAPTDGHSIKNVLLGQPLAQPEFLYWEYCNAGAPPDFPGTGWGQAVRMGDWKGIRINGLDIMLYDLSTDIHEDNDLSKDHPEVVATIRKIMCQEHIEDSWWPSGAGCCIEKEQPGAQCGTSPAAPVGCDGM